MITAQEARELGNYESRLAAALEAIEREIRKRAPSSRTQRLVMVFDMASIYDEELVGDLVSTLQKNGFTVYANRVEYESGGRETHAMEFNISWGS